MPKLRLATILLVVLAAGCTPMQWVKQDASPEQLNQDAAQCQQQAWREARWRSFLYRPLGPMLLHDRHGRALLGWPYSPLGDPFGDEFMEESRLARFCMRAKGYELQPVEKPVEQAEPSK